MSEKAHWKIRWLSVFTYAVIKGLSLSYRIRVIDDPRSRLRQESQFGGLVLACWHQNLLSCALSQKGLDLHPLASQSKDGEIVSYVLRKLGFQPIRGSSSRGAVAALANMIKTLKAGKAVAITVDGPKGPKGVVKPGSVEVAKRSGSVLLPFTAMPRRAWELRKSWDHFRVPKPFSIIDVHYGSPIFVAKDLSSEGFAEKVAELQEALDRLEKV